MAADALFAADRFLCLARSYVARAGMAPGRGLGAKAGLSSGSGDAEAEGWKMERLMLLKRLTDLEKELKVGGRDWGLWLTVEFKPWRVMAEGKRRGKQTEGVACCVHARQRCAFAGAGKGAH